MKRALALAASVLFTGFVSLPVVAQQHEPGDEGTPESVRAAFPNAQTFMLQHRELSRADVAAIEKTSDTRWIGEMDFHTYLAIGTTDGKRTQLGAATVVEDVSGAGDVTIACDNDLNSTKVTTSTSGSGATADRFLAQFAGKGHDDPIKLGQDIQYSGSDRATAAAITDAVRRATHTMQRLYGEAHSH